jgi:hypothetical protein
MAAAHVSAAFSLVSPVNAGLAVRYVWLNPSKNAPRIAAFAAFSWVAVAGA